MENYNKSSPGRQPRIVIDIDSSEDDSTDVEIVKPSARRRNVMQRGTLYDDDLSESSSSLEGYLRDLRIASPKETEDESIEKWFTSKSPEKKEPPKEVFDKSFQQESGNQSLNDDSDSTIASEVEENVLDTPWVFDSSKDEFYFDGSRDTSRQWPQFTLTGPLFRKLYDYQVTGVHWMGGLHHTNIGGILGDDMGMGKTFMASAFLGGLMKAGTIRNALIIAPVSVLRSWEKEAHAVIASCVPRVQISVLSSEMGKARRRRLLEKALKCTSTLPYLVISTYGMVRNSTADFSGDDASSYWNYIVLDEGHNIKNHKSQISQSCRAICSRKTRRLVLTGTPIMNNLEELWSLFDFATSGKVLGQLKQFKNYFSKPIELARDKFASNSEIDRGQRANLELQELLAPHFLQRLKVDYLADRLPQKTELVVWTHLSPEQRRRYADFLENGNSLVKDILSGKDKRVLEAITFLKKLCGHPMLVEGVDLPKNMRRHEIDKAIDQSAKLGILLHLVSSLCSKDHRVLIFSQSTKMLDVIERVLAGVSVSRIDGQTKERDRQRFVDEFNDKNSSAEVMLLSTKAAGVGLTLTGADRVVVYDPSWTPAEDSQAVDRAYRIGQTREVVVYRLIAAGTVEEKMYEKQIHKDGIRRTVFTTGESVQRYFVRDELSRMFALAPAGVCETMEKVQDVKANWSSQDFILSHRGVVGISRHDGFYQPSADDTESGGPRAAFPAASTPAPKAKGRSQRILQKDSSDGEPTALGRKNCGKQPKKDRSPPIPRRQKLPRSSAPLIRIPDASRNRAIPEIISIDIDDEVIAPKKPPAHAHNLSYDAARELGLNDTPYSRRVFQDVDTTQTHRASKERKSVLGVPSSLEPREAFGYSGVNRELVPTNHRCIDQNELSRDSISTRDLASLGGNSFKENFVNIAEEVAQPITSTKSPGSEAEMVVSGKSEAGKFKTHNQSPMVNSEGSSIYGDTQIGLTVPDTEATVPKTGVLTGEEVSSMSELARDIQSLGIDESTASKSIADILAHVESLAFQGQPKRALGLLMDVLDNRYEEVDKTVKIQFHQQIVDLAESLEMM